MISNQRLGNKTRFFAFVLLLVLPWGALVAQDSSDVAIPPPSGKYLELAGTIFLEKNGSLVFVSNGKDYFLAVDPKSAGARALKSKMPIIVKGWAKNTAEPGEPKHRTLTPSELVVLGREYKYS